MTTKAENPNTKLEQIENVSPQVPSLETECDKQEVVKPEVLKPSDNKDCSNDENADVSKEKLEAGSKKPFKLSQEAIDEQKENIAKFQKQRAILDGEQAIVDELNAAVDELYKHHKEVNEDITVDCGGKPITINISTSYEEVEGRKWQPIFLVKTKVLKGKKEEIKIPYDNHPQVDIPHSDVSRAVSDFLGRPIMNVIMCYNRPLFENYNAVMDKLMEYRSTHQVGFAGIKLPKNIEIRGNIAWMEKRNPETGKTYWSRVGSPCAIIACHKLIGDQGVEQVSHVIRFKTSTGDIEERKVPENSLLSASGINSIVNRGDSPLRIEHTGNFLQMIQEQYIMIEEELPIITEMDAMGWVDGDDRTFLYGSHNFGKVMQCADIDTCEIYKVEGTLDGWMDGMKGLINIPEVRIAMALGVASMILTKIGVQTIIVHIYGNTSQIKTIRVKACLSEFCNPNKAIMTFDHSKQAPNNTLKKRNDTVLLWDEVKTEKDNAEAELITKNASSGMTRQVLNYKTGKNEFKEFSNVIVFTSEKKMFGLATYGGTKARCIELKAGNIPYIPDAVKAFEKNIAAKARRDNYKKNYGHLLKPIYDVIHKYGTEKLRERFEVLTMQFEASSAIENRIADMQAAIALGNDILNEVFMELKKKYPFIEIMDSVELVKNLTADYVQDAAKPEWVEPLKLILNNADCDRYYFNEPEPQGQQGIVHTRPIKGYTHCSRKEGVWLCLNPSSLRTFVENHDLNYDTLMEQLRDQAKVLKTMTSRRGFEIPNPKKEAIDGSTVVAIMLDEVKKNEWFNSQEEISEEDKLELALKQEELLREETLKNFHNASGGVYLSYMYENDKFHLSHQEEFKTWLVKNGKSPEEAETINSRYVELYNIHMEHVKFYNEGTGHKLKFWTNIPDVYDVEGYWKEHHS